MKTCIAAILLVLSVAGRLSAAAAADHAADAIIRLPSHGLADGVEIAAEKKRPWKCCDTTWCSRSIPPACRCMDAVEQCDEACDRCEAAQSDPSKHVCIDRYRGWPGPSCTKPDADADVPSGPGVSGPPVVRQEATAAAAEMVVGEELVVDVPKGAGVSAPGAAAVVGQPGQAPPESEMAVGEEMSEVAVDGEKARPWKCCDRTVCTRSAPPTCRCHDKVKKCAKTCKNCRKDEMDSSRYVCGDSYFGWPGPRCTKF